MVCPRYDRGVLRSSLVLALLCGVACAADPDPAASSDTTAETATGATAPMTTTTADATTTDVGTDASTTTADVDPDSGSEATTTTGDVPASDARDWIIMHFADAPTVTGTFDERTTVETPALVLDASGGASKYAFDVREDEAPVLAEVGFVAVTIRDLVSDDPFGGGISTGYAPGAIVYLDDVYIEPNWPAWESYDTTNYDGMVLDESAAIYAEDLTITNWNADSAIDIKSPVAQFVRLRTEGAGNRALRFWEAGPHYLVDSSVSNPGGTMLWFSDCDAVTLNVYATLFDGQQEVPESAVECENGSAPNIVVLEVDPRTTGEMHEMFGG